MGAEGGIIFQGWPHIVRQAQRWRDTAPFMLRNAIACREELLQQPGLDEERGNWLAAERELFLQVQAGIQVTA